MQALDPVIKIMKYKAYEHADIREFYSLMRTTLIGARKAQLLLRLINNQTLPAIMARTAPGELEAVGQGEATVDPGKLGGRLLEVCGPEVEGLIKRGSC